MLTIDMIALLCCPACRAGELRAEIREQNENQVQEGDLICDPCNISYPIHLGIPDLIPYETLANTEWQIWKDQQEGLQARRQQRIRQPNRLAKRLAKKSKMQKEAFFKFARIEEGKILDVGCGAGKFRFHLDGKKVKYYGIDPIILPAVQTFPYVRALSEYIPFKDNTFSHLVVIGALDHFRDLNAFFLEAIRVLKANGKLHIQQIIHDITGPISATKVLAQWLKDQTTKTKNSQEPKRMARFCKSLLCDVLSDCFEIVSEQEQSLKWYRPKNVFISLLPRCHGTNSLSSSQKPYAESSG